VNALVTRLSGLTLHDPAWFGVALLLPLALWARTRTPRPTVTFAPAAFLGTARSLRQVLRPLPRVLAVVGLALLAFALARPQARKRAPDALEGIDILLCLDVSSSMRTRDMDGAGPASKPTRLAVAKEAAARFIAARPRDRIGLVTFARYADLDCPLTLDHQALTTLLGNVTTVEGEGPEDATGIGAAVARCAQVLRRGGGRSRVVILLTDGAENVGVDGASGEIPPAHAAQLCERLGVRVQAIVAGIGRRDASGKLVRIDTRPIENLALRTGGLFQRARDARALDEVYGRIDRLERAPVEEVHFVLEDRYALFVALGLALLLVGRILGATWLEVHP